MVPKLAEQAFIFVISSLVLGGGLWMMLRPQAAIDQDPDFAENATPRQALRNARIAGAIMALFGLLGLYLLFVEGLHPADPNDGVGV